MQPIHFSISEVPVPNTDTITTTTTGSLSSSVGGSPLFQLSQNRFFALKAWFARAFNGTVSRSYDLPRGILWAVDQVTASSHLLLVMYNNGHNISTSTGNLATSVSNYIRSSGGCFYPSNNMSNMASRTALGMQTYVHVRWAWLTLPVTCVVSALVYLVTIILMTRRLGALVWKSSVLPYLFHGLDQLIVTETSAGQVTEMLDAAANVKARLVKDGEGTWKLLRVGRRVERVDG